MPAPINLEGQEFGYLTVRQLLPERRNRSLVWKCECKCGNTINLRSDTLRSGLTKSCGCLKIESNISRTKHGATKIKSKEGNQQLDYSLWAGIKNRCYNKKCPSYKDYGGRGIKVYKKWLVHFKEFATYIRTLPNCPSEELLVSRLKGKRLKFSLDRIENDKGYKPGNLRWATYEEQARNKRNNIFVTYKGETGLLLDIVKKYSNYSYALVYQRHYIHGWSLHNALTATSNKPMKKLMRFNRK